jgi:paraquat-inducible protein A
MARVGPNALVACPDCDALQREPEGEAQHGCACWRCGAFLGPTYDPRIDRVFALAVTALVGFCITLAFPLMHINLQGISRQTTLLGASSALWSDGMQPVAALVFLTTVLVPGVDLVALVYLLGGVYFCERGWLARLPRFSVPMLRLAQAARSWTLLEVFMLGALVSLVRMRGQATVHSDVALWSLAALILLLAALGTAVHPRALWARLAEYGAVS